MYAVVFIFVHGLVVKIKAKLMCKQVVEKDVNIHNIHSFIHSFYLSQTTKIHNKTDCTLHR